MSTGDAPMLQRLIRRVEAATRANRGAEQVQAVLEDALRSSSDWLGAEYQQLRGNDSATYPLYESDTGRFCVVSLVIREGVTLPVHDHGAWAVLGIYKGRVKETWYQRLDDGNTPGIARLAPERTFIHERGAAGVLPEGQIHTATALGSSPAVTIQIYGTTLDKQGRTRFEVEAKRAVPYEAHYIRL